MCVYTWKYLCSLSRTSCWDLPHLRPCPFPPEEWVTHFFRDSFSKAAVFIGTEGWSAMAAEVKESQRWMWAVLLEYSQESGCWTWRLCVHSRRAGAAYPVDKSFPMKDRWQIVKAISNVVVDAIRHLNTKAPLILAFADCPLIVTRLLCLSSVGRDCVGLADKSVLVHWQFHFSSEF